MTPTTRQLRQLGLDHAMGELSSEAFLEQMCAAVGQRLRCARVSAWRLENDDDDGSKLLRCLALHDSHAAAPLAGVVLPEVQFPAYFHALTHDGTFESHDTLNDERLLGLRAGYLEPLDIRSMLDVAFSVNGQVLGVLCCENVGALRQWNPHDVAEIRRCGSILSLALARSLRMPDWRGTTAPAPLHELPPVSSAG